MTPINPLFINIFVLILTLWTIPWKIYAVWLAVKHNHKRWFIVLLILNTAGILEIFYIFNIAKKRWVNIKEDFKKAFSSIE